MDVALDEGDALPGRRSAELVVQGLAGQGDVPLEAALNAGIVGLADRTVGQHDVEQLGLVGVAARRADADDVVHIVELEQLVGVDADGGHSHAAAHHADGAALIGTGKTQHPADAGHLADILQKGVCNEFCAQGVTGHQDSFCEVAFFGADVGSCHSNRLLFLGYVRMNLSSVTQQNARFFPYLLPGKKFCGARYEPLRRISKWQWLPLERPVLPT